MELLDVVLSVDGRKVISLEEVAAKFGCTPQTILNWARQRRLPPPAPTKPSPHYKRWLWYEDEIDMVLSGEWVPEGKSKPMLPRRWGAKRTNQPLNRASQPAPGAKKS